MRAAKILTRLHGCAVWSGFLLLAKARDWYLSACTCLLDLCCSAKPVNWVPFCLHVPTGYFLLAKVRRLYLSACILPPKPANCIPFCLHVCTGSFLLAKVRKLYLSAYTWPLDLSYSPKPASCTFLHTRDHWILATRQSPQVVPFCIHVTTGSRLLAKARKLYLSAYTWPLDLDYSPKPASCTLLQTPNQWSCAARQIKV